MPGTETDALTETVGGPEMGTVVPARTRIRRHGATAADVIRSRFPLMVVLLFWLLRGERSLWPDCAAARMDD